MIQIFETMAKELIIIRNLICHPKVLKLDTGKRKLTALFKAPVTVPVSADTVKTNQDSDITKPDALTDNGILTHTDTVNKVGNVAIERQTSQPLLSRLRVSQQWQYTKTIVKAARYPVNSMQGLWELLTKHHKEELPDLIKLSQIALTLPLHTASCERVFSPQNLILTKQRSRLAPATSDKLLRTRLASNAGVILNFEDCLQCWHWLIKRLIKTKLTSERIHYKITLVLFLSCFLSIQVY